MIADILIDPQTGDGIVENGKLVTGECTAQNQWLLLVSEPYSFGQSPFACVGLSTWLDDDGEIGGGLQLEVAKKFRIDGMVIKSIKMNGVKLNIDAQYE